MQLGQYENPAPGVPRASAAAGYPTLRISHSDGRFVRSDTVQVVGDKLEVIPLGLLRSRQYWTRSGSRSHLTCQSRDGVVGLPSDFYPWDLSPFSGVPSNSQLPCEMCPFKGWIEGEQQPRCKQTWNIPALVVGWPEQVFMMPFTASSLGNLEKYVKPYRDKMATYLKTMHISLRKVSKGDSIWTTAYFDEGAETDARNHPRYSMLLAAVREFMQPRDEGSALPGFRVN